MLEQRNMRQKRHLIDLVGRRCNKVPNFALLIGAGASESSGVKTGTDMITEFRKQLYEQSRSSLVFEEWLTNQNWYHDEDEYSILFEKICDQASQRRIYVEECVKDAKPSWGYVYLANIIAQGYFNVIFAPNFDDLLNEACFLHAELRPLVCAHDSAVVDIRVTSARPKIIKLHGDFLYDSIKNTVKETDFLERNMRDKFTQFGREYGLVVVGYGGHDRSIMDTLETMLRSGGYFPNGLYWCVRKGEHTGRRLERLLERENTYWIEIEGFDEFMAELHNGLALKLPDTVADPYRATARRLNTFILPPAQEKHPIIEADISKLQSQLAYMEEIASGKYENLLPHVLLGDMARTRHDFSGALVYYEKAVTQNPNDHEALLGMFLSYYYIEDFAKALSVSEKMIERQPANTVGYRWKARVIQRLNRLDDAVETFKYALSLSSSQDSRVTLLTERANVFLLMQKWNEALADTQVALRSYANSHSLAIEQGHTPLVINQCIALKKTNHEQKSREILEKVLPLIKEKYHRACAFATLDEKDEMLTALKEAIQQDSNARMSARWDPDFRDYGSDPDFRKLVHG